MLEFRKRFPAYLYVIVFLLLVLVAYSFFADRSKEIVGASSETIINGTKYRMYSLEPDDIFAINNVVVVPIYPLTTGCQGNSYLLLFSDLSSETLGVNWVCTGTRAGNNTVFTKHVGPRAGLMYKDDKLFLLVSSDEGIDKEWNVKANKVGDWVVVVFYSKNGEIRYSLIYSGSGFLVESTQLPPTPGRIMLLKPDNEKIVYLERGLCPWIRENMTYIYAGYKYSYSIDYLKNYLMSGKRYEVSIEAQCVLNKIILSNNTIVPSSIDIAFNFTIETK